VSLSFRFLALAALIAILAIVGVWLGGEWTRAWLWPAALLLALLWLEHALSVRYQFRVRRTLPSTVELGRTLHVHYVLEVSPARAFFVEIAEVPPLLLRAPAWQSALPLHLEDASAQLARCSFEKTWPTLEIGTHTFSTIALRFLGVFGLCQWRRTLSVPDSVRVVPQSLTQAERRQFTRESGDIAQRKSGQGLELIGHRDYQPGDPTRSIDWKASAKSASESLKVRIMSEDKNLEIALLLDVGRRSKLASGGMRKLDHYVNLASRLTQAALGAGDTLHLLIYAERRIHELYNQRGSNGIRSVHRLLANVEPSAIAGDPLLAALALLQQVPRRSLVVFLADTESPEASHALLRASALLRRKHLPLIIWLHDTELLALASLRGAYQATPDAPWQAPAQQLAALEILRAEQDARKKLRNIGAVVVDAAPEHMDAKVLSAYSSLRKRKAV
jgi:uncharacterized protein (DUF58 family)